MSPNQNSDRLLLYGIWTGLILLLLVPLIISRETIFPFIVGRALYARTLIEIIFPLWLILAYRNSTYRPPRSWILGIFAIHLAFSFLAGFFGVSLQRSLWSTYERMQGLVDLTHWVALTVVLGSVLRTQMNWRYLFNANLVVCLIVALFGVAQYFEAENIPIYPFLQDRSTERLGSTLGNSAFLGTYLMVNLLLAIGFLVDSFVKAPSEPAASQAVRRRRRRAARRESSFDFVWLMRLFWVVTIAVGLWVLTLSGTRGALAGLVLGLGVASVAYMFLGRSRSMRLGVSAAVGVVILGFALLFSLRGTSAVQAIADSNILVNRLVSVSMEDAPVKSRILTLSVAAHSLISRPIFGFGPENYLVAYGRYYDSDLGTIETLDQAHNKPVEELVTNGVFGFLSYAAIWAMVAFVMFRSVRLKNQSNLILKLTVAAAFVAYFAQSLLLFDTPATFLQFVLLLGFVTVLEAELTASDAGINSIVSGNRLLERIRAGLGNGLGLDSRGGRILGFLRLRIAGSKVVQLAAIAAALTLILLNLYFVNFRTYSAATSIKRITSGNNTFDEAIGHIENSIDTFGPLANYPRLIFIRNVGDVWGNLSESQGNRTLATIRKESAEAIASEPGNWRIHMELARMYLRIAEESPKREYLDSGITHLEEARRLAPERVDISDFEERLNEVERRLEVTP